VRTSLSTVSVLANVTNAEEAEDTLVPPAVNVDVSELEASARVGLVASNDTRRKEATSRGNVSQNNIVHIDERLSLATTKRVEHAAGASTTRLFLLLGTNVDIPPDGEVDNHVFVKNVLDLTRSATWVSLNVDRFDGVVGFNVSESDISNTSVGAAGRDRTNSHTNTEDSYDVFNEVILCTSCNLVVSVTGLDSDGVVKTGDLNIVDVNVLTGGVNTVSVKRESRVVDGVIPGTIELEQILLLPNVNEDLQIVDFKVGNVTEV